MPDDEVTDRSIPVAVTATPTLARLNYQDAALSRNQGEKSWGELRKFFAWAGGIVGILFVVFLILGFIAAMLQPDRQPAKLAVCASNLKNIAAGLITYSNSHNGQYPDGLEEILRQGMTPQVLVCPASDDSPATGTLQQQVAQVAAGQHCSYVYLGKGLTIDAAPDTVLAYDKPGHHPHGWITVLFGDYHTEILTESQASAMVKAIVPGQPLFWPPRVAPASQPAGR